MKVRVIAYPYAVQYGEIEVPNDVKKEDIEEYLTENWDDIRFGEPSTEYGGTDFDFEIE